MNLTDLGKRWPLMLAINVGSVLVLCVVVKTIGVGFIAVACVVPLLMLDHYASVMEMTVSLGSWVQHYLGLGLLGAICLVSVSAVQKLPLWVLPFPTTIGIVFVLTLLGLLDVRRC